MQALHHIYVLKLVRMGLIPNKHKQFTEQMTEFAPLIKIDARIEMTKEESYKIYVMG